LFSSGSREITAVKGKVGTVLVSGEKAGFNGEQVFLRKASFAKCTLATPCIQIKAGRVHLAEGRIKVQRGSLYLKNFPFLPLPTLSLPADDYDSWPQLELGVNGERGLYLVGKLTHHFNDKFKLNYGLGLGTNKWVNLQASANWALTPSLLFGSDLNWETENSLDGKVRLVYQFSAAQLKAESQRNWQASEFSSGVNSLNLTFPLFNKTRAELSYTNSLNAVASGINRREDYGEE